MSKENTIRRIQRSWRIADDLQDELSGDDIESLASNLHSTLNLVKDCLRYQFEQLAGDQADILKQYEEDH